MVLRGSRIAVIATIMLTSASLFAITPTAGGDGGAMVGPVNDGNVTPNSAAADLFWRTDGTAGTWTGTNWSNPATATGGTAWTSGDDAFFTANSSVTFATTTVSDVTVSNASTVTVSQAGTLTLAGVRTFDIDTGSTLTWTNQSWSSAAGNEGAGIIKNGNGTLNLGAIGSNVRYDGGFTLNAGTVIVSGSSSFGTAGVLPATLTINGGDITVNFTNAADRTFLNPITLAGNVTLDNLGSVNNAAIFAGNMAIGTAIRTITNNAPTTSARTFSGVISGGSGGGLEFAGTGRTVLTGTNTYTGSTTIDSGATLQVGNGGTTGSLSPSSAITDNGTLRFDRTTGSDFVQGTDFTSSGITGTGGIVKEGTASLTFNVANTFSGGLTINKGTVIATANGALGTGNISLTSGNAVVLTLQGGTNPNYIADSANLSIALDSTVNLNYSGTEVVNGFSVNGVDQAPGTYGSADFSELAGNGTITVLVPEPTTVGMMLLGGGLLTALRRFRRK